MAGFFQELHNRKQIKRIIKISNFDNLKFKKDNYPLTFKLNIDSWVKLNKKFITTKNSGTINFRLEDKNLHIKTSSCLEELSYKINYEKFKTKELQLLFSNDSEVAILGLITFLKRIYNL